MQATYNMQATSYAPNFQGANTAGYAPMQPVPSQNPYAGATAPMQPVPNQNPYAGVVVPNQMIMLPGAPSSEKKKSCGCCCISVIIVAVVIGVFGLLMMLGLRKGGSESQAAAVSHDKLMEEHQQFTRDLVKKYDNFNLERVKDSEAQKKKISNAEKQLQAMTLASRNNWLMNQLADQIRDSSLKSTQKDESATESYYTKEESDGLKAFLEKFSQLPSFANALKTQFGEDFLSDKGALISKKFQDVVVAAGKIIGKHKPPVTWSKLDSDDKGAVNEALQACHSPKPNLVLSAAQSTTVLDENTLKKVGSVCGAVVSELVSELGKADVAENRIAISLRNVLKRGQ